MSAAALLSFFAMNPEPVATYRIQLRPGFGFSEAAEIIPYLADLGISHLYLSPCLQAAAGSTHGYDVIDPSLVNEELGGEEAHARLCRLINSAGLGQMLDIVPNHMAISGGHNPWWWDVLEYGASSRYASYFDIDWKASPDRWPGKILLPCLGDQYGTILENGEFILSFENGVFILHYHDNAFPVNPASLAELMENAATACESELLSFLSESYARLARPGSGDYQERRCEQTIFSGLPAKLYREDPKAAEALKVEVDRLNRDPEAMDVLLSRQHYRLAYWRMAGGELGYRRFFDVKDLAGLRIEEKEVFFTVHKLPLSWVREGWVQGLRIDHPDGLRDPGVYFKRLREACPEAWIIAEKILEPGEELPAEWPIEGTTGYDFLNLAGGLIIDPEGEEPLTRIYRNFTGEEADYPDLVHRCKIQVLSELLDSELNRLTRLFIEVCEKHRRNRDYTRHELHEALCETAACFPVYRSYVSGSGKVSPADEKTITCVIDVAMKSRTDLDPVLFEFLKDLLLLRIDGSQELDLALQFQQLTGPAMAKGVEDTALYRYFRLTALNEVGGNPDHFGVSISRFHQACSDRRERQPLSLLASTTHDTKRSEDVRSRLALLSEIPEKWDEAVRRWGAHNAKYRSGGIPDRNTEYLLYQTLVGAWPIDPERIGTYMDKAIREAKRFTSWSRRNLEYEKGVKEFIEKALEDPDFLSDLENFVGGLIRPGRINSLALTLIKLTAPGIPDLYQGTELWDLSLVDPDNRRPVDYARRRSLLKELQDLSLEEILARADEGLPKLWLIYQTLKLRRSRPGEFGPEGAYHPLAARGSKSDHVVAFLRGNGVLTVVPRLVLRVNGDWDDTVLDLPGENWRNVLTGEKACGTVMLRGMLARFPVGLFERKEEK